MNQGGIADSGAAFLLVATQNFSGAITRPFVLVGVVRMLLILLPVAKRMGARSPATAGPAMRAHWVCQEEA